MRKLLFILTIVLSLPLMSQNLALTVDDMFAIADSTEISLRAARLGVEVAAQDIELCRSALYPEMSTTLSVGYLGNGYVWDRDFSNGMKIDIPHFGTNFALEIQQVIYAGGAIDNAIALSKKGKEMAELEYEKNRQQIHFSLIGNYLNLYKAINQVQAYDQNIALVEKLIEKLNSKKEQGTILSNALTRYELQLENLKLQRQRLINTKAVFNRQLVTSLKLNQDVEIQPDSTLLTMLIDLGTETDWQQQALYGSIALKQAGMGVDINNIKENIERSNKLPKVALVAQDHLDGPVTIEVPPLNNNFNYWFVGVGLNYDISSLYKSNSKQRSAQLNTMRSREQLELAHEKISNAVQEAYIRLNEARNEVEVQTKNLELARLNYNITNSRYLNDLALLTDMLDASNAMLAAELDLKNAQINLIFSYYTLNYLCGKI